MSMEESFEPYTPEQEMEIKNEEIKYLRDKLNDYTEILRYLSDEIIGDIRPIIESISELDEFSIIGDVEGKFVVKNNMLYIEAEVPDLLNSEKKRNYLFEWQHNSNYAVYQVTEFEDSYYGYMLYPCYGNKFVCVYYRC